MYTISSEAIIKGDVKTIWAIISDVNNWPTWDPHEEAARLDGPFATGTKGWSKPHGGPAANWTITEVVEKQRWCSEAPLPGGKLSGENTFEPLSDGRVRCTKTIFVKGPLVALFRLYFGRGIRKDMAKSWEALEREVARRQAV